MRKTVVDADVITGMVAEAATMAAVEIMMTGGSTHHRRNPIPTPAGVMGTATTVEAEIRTGVGTMHLDQDAAIGLAQGLRTSIEGTEQKKAKSKSKVQASCREEERPLSHLRFRITTAVRTSLRRLPAAAESTLTARAVLPTIKPNTLPKGIRTSIA